MTTTTNYKLFDEIQIGKKFKTLSNITYQKMSATEAKPILTSDNQTITNGLITPAFYKSKIRLEEV